MRLVTQSPFAQLDAARREVNGLLRSFDRAFAADRPAAPSATDAAPPFNLYEAEDAWVLTAELPGLDPEAVEVSVEADVLSVTGERPEAEAPEGARWLRRERPRGAFARSVKLPFVPPADGVAAEFARGVLTLTLRKPEETKARRIAVTAG